MNFKTVIFLVIAFSLGACGGGDGTASSSSPASLSFPANIELISS